MRNFIVLKSGFKHIKKDSEVEIILNEGVERVNGKVVENNLRQLFIRIDEVSTDTIVSYDQIKSVEVFELDNKWQGATKESTLESIRKGELIPRDLPPEFRNDKEVVLEAAKRFYYHNLKYVQNNPNDVLAAIELGTPSFMGKANDEDFLSRSLEAISNHLSLFDSNDLNFLYVSKHNFPLIESDVESMGWYKKIFSDEAKYLRMMKKLYRERIDIFMKRIQAADEYNKKQKVIELEEIRRKKWYESYITLRAEIEQMPISQRWKQDVRKKCENKCQMCGSNKNTEVHHLDSFYLILKQNNINSIEKAFECKKLWNVDNGEVLCKKCHDKMESSKYRALKNST